jgi:tryptophanyl-tRNA synthetase
LGNFLGAIQSWAKIQERGDCLFFLADLHAITVAQDPNQLRANTLDSAAMYLACGIDPKKSHIFAQSHVLGHAELAWVLGCSTPLGQLERMTQFKDKSARQRDDFIGAGLLYYPVLMAADILLYNADLVPVGEDQRQHVELARDAAERFNHSHGPMFRVPEAVFPESCARVMSLQTPTAKMSKSDPNGLGTVFLSDSDGQIRKKFRSAVTDSGREIRATEEKPGIANLLEILSGLTGIPVAELEQRHGGDSYGAFKDTVADAAIAALGPIRERFFQFRERRDELQEILDAGRAEAQGRARTMLSAVYERVGFLQLLRGSWALS